ncbi:MAG: hypothetical protein AAGF45_00120, partial [Pseudomonadota bacterium]
LPVRVAHSAEAGPVVLEAPERETAVRYRDATARHRLNDGVTYYDPLRPAPELRADRRAERMVNERDGVTIGLPDRGFWSIVFAVIFLTVVFFAFRFGLRPNIVISSPQEGRRAKVRRIGAPGASGRPGGGAVPSGLEKIAAIADRREALVALAQAVLARALDANGLLPGRSWTMRDAVARIPAAWPHRERLASLAFASEVAHFGGRDVSEPAFQAHLADATEILRADQE